MKVPARGLVGGVGALVLALGCGSSGDAPSSGTSSTTGSSASGSSSTATSSSSGAGGHGGAGGAGSGGAGGAGPTPWSGGVELCGNDKDDDGDGRVDEDCPPSLWAGAFVTGGGKDFTTGKEAERIAADAGRPLSVIQTYRGMSPAGVAAIGPDLDAIFTHGAVVHLNLEPAGYTASQYANAATDPGIDADMSALALAVTNVLASHPTGRVLFTFGAEMNGSWTDWGCLPPATYIAFYRAAHDRVTKALASAAPPIEPRRLRWVYGPNVTSSAGCGSAAAYYPGHDVVDYVGMSAYRSATESVSAAVIDPAKALLSALGYPAEWQRDRFILLQTGSRVIAGDDRGAWIKGLYDGLTADPAFLGVVYFNDQDWAVLDASVPPQPLAGYDAFTAAIAALPTADAKLEGTFEPFFWDVHFGDADYPEIQALRAANLTSGCSATPPLYCPTKPLARGDAAVLLARAFGIQPAPTGSFTDVPIASPAAGAIGALAKAGAMVGCSATTFCPNDAVTRGDLAAALGVLGASPPGPKGAFADLAPADPRTPAIEALAALGRVDGCTSTAFCPDDPATRAAGAAWIVRTAGVPPAPRP